MNTSQFDFSYLFDETREEKATVAYLHDLRRAAVRTSKSQAAANNAMADYLRRKAEIAEIDSQQRGLHADQIQEKTIALLNAQIAAVNGAARDALLASIHHDQRLAELHQATLGLLRAQTAHIQAKTRKEEAITTMIHSVMELIKSGAGVFSRLVSFSMTFK